MVDHEPEARSLAAGFSFFACGRFPNQQWAAKRLRSVVPALKGSKLTVDRCKTRVWINGRI